MTKRFAVTLAALMALLPAAACEQQTSAVHADMGQDTINKHIYGHFAEHLGRMIYDGVWVQDPSGDWYLRDDVIEALRGIEIPNLRWPGGCFADYYHWEDGIGPPEERPAMVNLSWGGDLEDNSFGTHEFMELVRRLDTEPYIVGNVGTGSPAEMRDWWEYLNRPYGPMADRRADNGHAEPFNVEFFQIGNENWGCGGRMTPEYYSDLVKQYATFIRNIDDVRPFRIVTGPSGANYDWTEGVMRDAGRSIDGLDFHYYTRVRGEGLSRSSVEYGEAEWFVGMRAAQRIDEMIRGHSEIMDRYDPDKRVWLIVGEWGMWHETGYDDTNPRHLYQQNTIRDGVVAGLHLNVFNNHADRVKMGNLAQTVNVLQSVILTRSPDEMVLTPTYHVFEMYTPHHDALLLPFELDPQTYEYEGESIDAVSGSASLKGGQITISLVNMDPNRARTVTTEIRGPSVSQVTGRILTADSITAHNTFEQPNTVRPTEFGDARLDGQDLTVDLPPMSVVVLQLQ